MKLKLKRQLGESSAPSYLPQFFSLLDHLHLLVL